MSKNYMKWTDEFIEFRLVLGLLIVHSDSIATQEWICLDIYQEDCVLVGDGVLIQFLRLLQLL